ncbi:MAG: hypothetical protein ACI9DC_003250 [Gammaproteobacteria bacterium]
MHRSELMFEHTEHTLNAQVPRAATWLGASGLIPFVAGAAALWMLPTAHTSIAADVLIGYGAIILTFMGAVHWGLAMARGAAPGMARWFAISVVPALIGWCALMMPPLTALTMLALAFTAVFAMDNAAIAAGLAPAWYRRLRAPLTAAVVGSLAVASAALCFRLS